MNRRRVRALGFVAGLIGLGVAVATTARDVDGTVLPGRMAFGVALVAATVSLLAAGRSWVALLDAGDDRREVLGALYLSQLSKYLPAGGLIQAAGQVAMSANARIPVGRTAVAYPVAMLEVVVAGALLGAGLAFSDTVPIWGRVLAGAAPLALGALHPAVLRCLLRAAGRLSSRVPAPDLLPAPSTIVRSTAWAVLNMLATTVAFVAILHSINGDLDVAVAFSAFAAAWVVGFLVVPVPSGLGVREAILVVAVPGLRPGEILAASLAHRIATVVAEVVVTSGNAVDRRRRARVVPTGDGAGTTSAPE